MRYLRRRKDSITHVTKKVIEYTSQNRKISKKESNCMHALTAGKDRVERDVDERFGPNGNLAEVLEGGKKRRTDGHLLISKMLPRRGCK